MTKAKTKSAPKAAAKTETRARPVQQIALAACNLSPLNPRQNVPDDEIAALAVSIRTVGLIQNLSGITEPDGRIGIVAGGKRLRALRLIAKEDGSDATGVMVPVMLADSETEAQAWAVAENEARSQPHPADEIRAYGQMQAKGITPPEIAMAFGVTERHVKGRLRLAGLAQPVLDALAADQITLDLASAYTVCADPDRQEAVFAELKDAWHHNAHEVRRRLMAEAAEGDSRLARFVGREAYEANGGIVREDLFGEDVYFEDAELLQTLAMEKLRQEACTHRAAGWMWVDAAFERPGYEQTSKLARTYPQPVEHTDEDAARYDELAERVETGAASEAEEAELKALTERLDREEFTPEQMALSGAILYIGYHGVIAADCGLIHDEDRKAAEDAGLCRTSHHTAPKAEKKNGVYSGALMDDLAHVRTGALQTALLDNPALALDLLIFALATPVCSSALPLDIQTGDAANAPKDGAGMDLPKALRSYATHNLPMQAGDAAEAFAAFRRRKPETKARMLTEHVARILSIGMAGEAANPLAESVAAQAALDVRRVWTPTEAFFKRLTKAQLLEIHQHVMDREAPSAQLAKQAKSSVAKWLHLMFNGGEHAPALTDEQRARAQAWLPEGMGLAKPKESKAGTSEPGGPSSSPKAAKTASNAA